MLTYHAFLVKKLNKQIDIVKNIKLADFETERAIPSVSKLMKEIQINKLSAKIRDKYRDDELWNDYLYERDRR